MADVNVLLIRSQGGLKSSISAKYHFPFIMTPLAGISFLRLPTTVVRRKPTLSANPRFLFHGFACEMLHDTAPRLMPEGSKHFDQLTMTLSTRTVLPSLLRASVEITLGLTCRILFEHCACDAFHFSHENSRGVDVSILPKDQTITGQSEVVASEDVPEVIHPMPSEGCSLCGAMLAVERRNILPQTSASVPAYFSFSLNFFGVTLYQKPFINLLSCSYLKGSVVVANYSVPLTTVPSFRV